MEKRKTEKKVDLDDDDISIDEEEPNIILLGNEDRSEERRVGKECRFR